MVCKRVLNFDSGTAHHFHILWFLRLQIRLQDRNLNSSLPGWCQSCSCIDVQREKVVIGFIRQSNSMIGCGWTILYDVGIYREVS